MKKSWVLFGIIGISIIIVLGLVGVLAVKHLIKTSPAIARKVNEPMPVQVVAAKQTDITEVIGATGEVQPIALVNLTAKVSVRIEKVRVDIGDMVKPGQELMRFDHDLLKAALTTARSKMSQADGELDKANQYFKRIKAVYDQGFLPKIELEEAQVALDKAWADYRKAEEMLLQAKKDLQNGAITSPVLGIVMEKLINQGEIPSIDQKLFTIGQIDKVLIEAKIAEERVGDIHIKQSATVAFNAFPNDVIEGEVVKIKPVTDKETKTFLVYVKLSNPNLKLKPGLTGFIRIKKERNTLAVPSISIINPTGVRESSLFIIDEGLIVRLKRVKIGMVAEGMTEILDGLAEGDNVVTVGQFNLRDGDHVRIGDEFNEIKSKYVEKPH